MNFVLRHALSRLFKENFNMTEYVSRAYRNNVLSNDLLQYRVAIGESDIFILTAGDFQDIAKNELIHLRRGLRQYISDHPEFRSSLKPVEVNPQAVPLVHKMANAASTMNVGPMAAVAGAISEALGRALMRYTDDVIVENGGDIFMKSTRDRYVQIFAGNSPLSNRMGLKIRAGIMPCGICTSAGTVGPSISYGKADAVVIVASDTALADAAATVIGNKIVSKCHVKDGVAMGKERKSLLGGVIIKDDVMGAWGNIEIMDMTGRDS